MNSNGKGNNGYLTTQRGSDDGGQEAEVMGRLWLPRGGMVAPAARRGVGMVGVWLGLGGGLGGNWLATSRGRWWHKLSLSAAVKRVGRGDIM